jgi:molybdopterin converting factor subunit 1
MKRLTVKLFATLRERANTGEIQREFDNSATVGDIWRSLVGQFPALAGNRDAIAFAVNQEYVAADFKPRDQDEVAFIPPVSGGS